MLTDIERREIERELAHYPHKQAGCVEALKIVQRHRSWVSDDSLRELASLLDMSAEELDGVATFYNLIFRKPVGRHVAFVCDSISCWIAGNAQLRERLEQRLGIRYGQTTADGRFTVLPIACLGACDEAPVMLVDADLHRNVEPEQLGAILERYK